MEKGNVARFLLTFFLGFIGSFIINHTRLKPKNQTSRTLGYLFWGIITLGIYVLVASICNLFFSSDKSNIGYKMDYIPPVSQEEPVEKIE